jgi:hypothetical protein
MRNKAGQYLPITVPSEAHFPELLPFVAEQNRLLAERQRVGQEYDRLWLEQDAAKVQDTQARADALRAQEPAPGNVHQDQNAKAIRECKETFDALLVALEDNERDAMAVVEQHRDKLLADLDKREHDAAAAQAKALEKAQAERRKRMQARAARRFLTDLGKTFTTYDPADPPIIGLIGRNGEPVPAPQVWAALKADTELVQPKTHSADVQPLQQRPPSEFAYVGPSGGVGAHVGGRQPVVGATSESVNAMLKRVADRKRTMT